MKDYNTKEVQEALKNFIDIHRDEEPIYKGCRNKVCHCTGECKEIIGWKPKNKEDIWINL